MPYDDAPANWLTAITSDRPAPIYYLDVDGVAENYSTGPVDTPPATTVELMDTPRGGGGSVDVIEGRQTTREATVRLVDHEGKLTTLIATEASGAEVPSLINRKATIYGGDRSLVGADYAAIFTGRISSVRLLNDLATYELRLSDPSYLFDAKRIMLNAADTTPAEVRGNAVNVYASILRGVFSTSDPDFPLDHVSSATATTSAPTGLDIPDALLDLDEMKTSRDTWHPSSTLEFSWTEPEDARAWLEAQLFRVMQCWPAIGGNGLVGLRFHVPPVPASAATEVKELDDILAITGWRRRFEDHLNRFRVLGDWNPILGDYITTLYDQESSDDTQNQTDTDETIEYLLESKGLKTLYDGAGLAAELMGRLRIRFLTTPAEVTALLSFKRRDLEEGDVVSLTDADVPNLADGTRGVTDKLMTVTAITPQWDQGLLQVTLLDTGISRYGAIAPNSIPDYGSASTVERQTYTWIGRASDNKVGAGADEGYRMV